MLKFCENPYGSMY